MQNTIIAERLREAIPNGKENAIHQAELAKRLGVTTNIARTMVSIARKCGVPVLSGNMGYWLANDELSRAAFVNAMKQRAETQKETAALIAKAVLERV